MKVSVIIPFYSNVTWLKEAVDSVLAQTFSDYEIIVVDDGSPENIKDFIEEYQPRIKYFKTENKGPAHARNYGIKEARGDYLAFLDSDDLWLKEKLEKQVRLMEDDNLNWSHTKYSVFDEVQNKSDRVYQEIHNEDFKGIVYPKSLTKLHIGTPCVMVRKSYLLKNSFIRFSENMRYGQDGYFWILMSVKNKLGYIDENLTLVRRAGSNAVQRARVHLNVRGNLNKNLISQLNKFYPEISISFLAKITYKYCDAMNRAVDNIYGTKDFKRKSSEIFSKIAYLPAYVMFKNIIK
ncbi:glycosyltransferase involved in cell wall biosynthesis [Pedobacter sp. UYP30]|uniref:glycosyltransferase family 2 protein n=1 Tax=Pedobacter sp. UYP30 TaxID=1756400 RepID=UPI003391552F